MRLRDRWRSPDRAGEATGNVTEPEGLTGPSLTVQAAGAWGQNQREDASDQDCAARCSVDRRRRGAAGLPACGIGPSGRSQLDRCPVGNADDEHQRDEREPEDEQLSWTRWGSSFLSIHGTRPTAPAPPAR